MKNTVVKASAALATAVTLSLSIASLATAAPGGPTASGEDPSTNGYLVGVGSDTIQDVEYGISQDLGTEADGTTPALTSWTATGTNNFTTRSGVTVVAAGATSTQAIRPNGSGPGYKALLDSIGATSGVSGFKVGDVDYSRASGTQGVQQSGSTGVTTDIPFAIDSISTAVPAGSPFLLTNNGHGLTINDLVNIYSSQVNEVNTSTGLLQKEATAGTVDAGFQAIQAFLPKPGSGSRQFFLGQLAALDSTDINLAAGGSSKGDGLFTNAGTPASSTPYVGATDYSGAAVQEHDAQVLTDSTTHSVASIAPFSAAKFIGYHNGLIADPDTGKVAGTDYVLVPFDSTVNTSGPSTPAGAVLPYTGDASSTSSTLVPNALYPTYAQKGTEAATFSLTREVYNIIPTQAWLHPNANAKYRALTDTFVGKGSKVCLDINTIKAYGFLADSANCGTTGKSYGSDATHTGYDVPTITESNSAAVAGRSSVVTFNVASNGDGGGSLAVTIDGKSYLGVIAPGAHTISFTIPTAKAGSISFGGGAKDGFFPNLAGVAPAGIAASSFAVAKAAPAVHATAATVSHTKAGKVLVTVTASGVAPTGHVTVIIKKGSAAKVTKTVTLSGGKATAALKKLSKGSYTVYVSYTGDGNVAAKASTKLATLKVS
jgi:hypothetical protein